MRELKPTRQLLTGYLISLLILVTLLLRVEQIRNIISNIKNFAVLFLGKITPSLSADWISWLSVILTCFLILFLIKKIFVDALHLHSDDESGRNAWESGVFSIAVFGAFIYYVNTYFNLTMPNVIWQPIRLVLGDAQVRDPGVELIWTAGMMLILFFVATTARSHRTIPAA